MKRRDAWVLSALLFGASFLGAAEPDRVGTQVRPQHLAPSSTSWSGSQFVQADGRGRIVLLRAEALEVYALEADGQLGEVQRLQGSSSAGPALDFFVLDAVMAGSGDWVLNLGKGVRLFRRGQEEPLDNPRWQISGLGALRGDPVIAGTGGDVLAQVFLKKGRPEATPLLLTWRGQQWETFGSTSETLPDPKPLELDIRRALRLGSTADGRLWAAFSYRHQFHEYSSSGRLLTEIVVDGGEVHEVEDAEARRQQAAKTESELAREGIRSHIVEVTARPVGIAVSEGRDGRMYFLVHGGSEAAGSQISLERFDPARAVLERVPLPIPPPGRGSMAAGLDGLYIAPFRPKDGLWRIPWEDLDAAEWEPVQGVEIGISDPSKLEGVWREKEGRGLVRFAQDKVITWEDGRLTVRGLVSLEGREALLRRSGFGENWKISLRQQGLRIERDGSGREYTRLADIPKSVSLDPAPLGKVKTLAPERVQAVQNELEQRTLKARKARESTDPNERLAVDADNVEFLRRLTAEVGWIDAGRFGVKAASQAAVLAQNSLDILLMLAALPKVEKDLKDLPEGGPVFAAFSDSLQIALGGKQRYGTQIVPDAGGNPVVLPLERRAEVDAARRKLGLLSLPEALAALSREVFDGKPVRIAEGEVIEAPPAAARQAGTQPAASSVPGLPRRAGAHP